MPLLFKKGGIYIKPENRDKFTATKKKTGKSTEELTHSKNPLTRKRAIFAQNAKKWKHKGRKKEWGGIMLKCGKAMKAENGLRMDDGGKDPYKRVYTYDDQKGYVPTINVPEDFGFGDLNTLQNTVDQWESGKFTPAKGLENETYFRYVAPDNVPKFEKFGCTGSSCRAAKQFNPTLPTPYDYLHRIGISGASTKGETSEYAGIDAWELPQMLQKTGKGTIVFAQDYNDHSGSGSINPNRKKYIESFNFKQLPLNTILSFGSARGEYVDPDANWSGDNKNAMARHTMALVKYDEATGDAYIYNPGYSGKRGKGVSSMVRVGDSKDADFTWKDFADEYKLVYATTLKGTEDMTYDKLKHYKNRKTNPSNLQLLQSKKVTSVQ